MKTRILSAVVIGAFLTGCGGGGGGSSSSTGSGPGPGGTFCTSGSSCAGMPMSESPAPSSPPPTSAVGHWTGTAGPFNVDLRFSSTIVFGSDVAGTSTEPGEGGSSTVIGGINGSRYLDITTIDNTSPGANNNFYFRIVGQLTLGSNGHMTGTGAIEEASINPSRLSNGNVCAIDIAPAP